MNSYEALRSNAAWIDFSGRGQIRVAGEDRARLLHAMSTNDVNGLAEHWGLYAFFLTAQGRIIADAYIYNLGESFWLDTEPETREKLLAHLEKYIIADDVTLEDESENWAVIGIEGPGTLDSASSLGQDLPQGDFAIKKWGDGFAVRLAATGPTGVRIFVPAAAKTKLVAQLRELGIPQASPEEVKIVRLENGRARYGDDISERYLVQETQILSAVSFNKGCYLGQEIVERVRSRGQVHRLLTPVRIRTREAPTPGTKLRSGDKDAGEITSAAFSPALNEAVALGYLRTESSTKGTHLSIGETEEAYVP
ncbi:MAG: YgfZ/GcvT domain-containing protein [Bryobacteraceae bacterium]